MCAALLFICSCMEFYNLLETHAARKYKHNDNVQTKQFKADTNVCLHIRQNTVQRVNCLCGWTYASNSLFLFSSSKWQRKMMRDIWSFRLRQWHSPGIHLNLINCNAKQLNFYYCCAAVPLHVFDILCNKKTEKRVYRSINAFLLPDKWRTYYQLPNILFPNVCGKYDDEWVFEPKRRKEKKERIYIASAQLREHSSTKFQNCYLIVRIKFIMHVNGKE